MSEKQLKLKILGRFAQVRGSAQYRLELMAAVIRVSREYGISISNSVLENLTFADEDELDLMLAPDVKGLDVKRSQVR